MSLEDAANIFSREIGGASSAPRAVERPANNDRSPPEHFGDHDMEPGEGGNGEEGGNDYDEGGDYAEEKAERAKPQRREGQRRDEDTGRYLKNEGPIDDEGGEGEGEDDEGGEEGGEGGEESEPSGRAPEIDPNTKVTVKIDGQDREVTFKEATEGYIRTQTFHQRMTALDNDRQELDRGRAHLGNVLQQQQKGLEDILLELKTIEPAEPNWDELYRTNPTEAARQKVLWDRYVSGKEELQRKHKQVVEARQQEHLRGLNEYVGKEANKLLALYPHWKEQGAREKDQAAIKNTLKSAGFTDQECSQLYDSRMVVIAMKAARFDRLSSKGMKPRPSNARPMPPGSGARRRSGPSNGNRALRDHANSQTMDSAVGAFKSILDQEA